MLSRVPRVILIDNAAKGSAVNGHGPEARANVHPAYFSNRDETGEAETQGQEGKGTQATLDEQTKRRRRRRRRRKVAIVD